MCAHAFKLKGPTVRISVQSSGQVSLGKEIEILDILEKDNPNYR